MYISEVMVAQLSSLTTVFASYRCVVETGDYKVTRVDFLYVNWDQGHAQ